MAQIIPKNLASVEPNWQKELASAFTDPADLMNFLGIDPSTVAQHFGARRLFPVRVPRHFAGLMKKGDLNDPLLRQVMPLAEEFDATPGYTADPLEEHDTAARGLLHKYKSRVLLIVRGGCAVNCRYCFRRHFPYADNSASKAQWQEALDYIAANDNIDEVILSGGDPLMANDAHLQWLASHIDAIGHIKRLRIHTRLPVVMPNRITTDFTQWFTTLKAKPILVIHANHANEISLPLKQKLLSLRERGVTLLNQSVLLAGVNDRADTLVDLHEALFDAGVLPYYLHVLDRVQGAAHFDVSDEDARTLMAQVIERQPGYLVPKLVREIAGQPGKTPIDLRLYP